MYGITNTINIRGYPQAEYVSKVPLTDKKTLYDYYNIDDFYLLVLGGDIPGHSRDTALLLLSALQDDLHPVSFSLLCHNYFRLNKVDISFLLCIPEGLLETVLLDVPDALAGNLKCHEPLF